MRIGEQLVRDGVITAEQLEQALGSQILFGGRVGTNLVELNHVDLDVLAEALAVQHGLPAALQKHFDRSDASLQARVPAELAGALRAVPLGLIEESPRRAAVAFLDPPPPHALDELREALAAEVIAAIAPELRVLYHLERAYGIQRANRFL